MKFTESILTQLLAARHIDDVIIPQCKNGPTWSSSHLRIFDAWVLKRTWKPVTTIGYEIKVSRSDFLQDEKWEEALEYCHQFYFVCPPKLIKPEEVPKDVGLFWASANATKLYNKKKAPRRQIEIPQEILFYILMSRARIVASSYGSHEQQNKDYWTTWLKEKEENQELGHKVSQRIQRHYSKMQVECFAMQKRMEAYDEIDRRLQEIGIDLKKQDVWAAYRKIDELGGRDIVRDTQQLATQLTKFANELSAHVEKKQEEPIKRLKRPCIKLPPKTK